MPRRPANRKPKPSPGVLQSGLTPLAYLLGVVNDATADARRRDRAAIAAAQYCHPRAADYRKGKKDLRDEQAKTAGMGTRWEDDLESDGPLPQ